MSDTRKKNANWELNVDQRGMVSTNDAQLAVLMDIRDELQRLNRTMECHNTQDIPNILRKIRANTTKPRKKNK